MTTRLLQKQGPTITLRPVEPGQTPGGNTATLTPQEVFPPIDDDAGLYVGTPLQTSPTVADRGFIYYGPDLQPKGVYWSPGIINESSVVVSFRKRFVNYAGKAIAVITPEPSVTPPFNRYEISVITNVDFTVAARVDEPSAVFTVDFTSQVQGWANRTSVFGYGFGGAGPDTVTNSRPGFLNYLYTSSDAASSMLCALIEQDGKVSSHAAFPLSQAGYSLASNHMTYTTVATRIEDLAFWTYVENYEFTLNSPIYSRLINWRRSFWGNSASAWDSFQVIQFSDPADQLLFDTYFAVNAAFTHKYVSGGRMVFIFNTGGAGGTLDAPLKVLVIDENWETYQSFFIDYGDFAPPAPPPSVTWINRYFQDPEGNHYGLEVGFGRIYRLYPEGIAPPSSGLAAPLEDPQPGNGSPVVRSWGFTLDGHNFLVNRLGNQGTLIYDATTGEWTPWASPGETVWTAHQGFNWLGMSAANYGGGATSNVVAGDDATGTLWTLAPASGLDGDSLTPGGLQAFTRKVVGGIPLRQRQTAPASAVFLTTNLGDPAGADTNAEVFLETSDDYGKTWQNQGAVTLTLGEYSQKVVWRSLGLMRAPGRLFRFTDYGATTRIDGADLLTRGEEE